MKKDFIVGIFDDEEKLLAVTEKATDKKVPIYDIYTPFPVHGLDEAMGIKRSILPYVTFVAGATGMLFALGYQIWTLGINWPINIGGKPSISIPSFIPITFEVTVLFGAHTTVAAFLALCKLFPGKKPVIVHEEQTCNKFVMCIDKDEVSFEDVDKLLKDGGALEVKLQNIDLNP